MSSESSFSEARSADRGGRLNVPNCSVTSPSTARHELPEVVDHALLRHRNADNSHRGGLLSSRGNVGARDDLPALRAAISSRREPAVLLNQPVQVHRQ